MAASRDGSLVVAAGELGQLAALDLQTWEMAEWPRVERGLVDHRLDILPDGGLVAVTVAATRARVEIRDRSGAVVSSIPTPRNTRVSWSPDGKLLVGVIEPDARHKQAQLALLDPRSGKCRVLESSPFDSVAAAWIDNDTALAFARRPDEPGSEDDASAMREQHRVLRISRAGRVKDAGTTELWDAFSRVAPVGEDRALACGYNFGWRLIRTGDLEVVAEGQRRAVTAACAHEHGFVVANGKEILCHDLKGKRVARKLAKVRIESLTVAQGLLLVQENGTPSRPAEIEILPL